MFNTRNDLYAAPQEKRDQFMQLLAGSIYRLEKDDSIQSWKVVEDLSTVERFGFTKADFPSATSPELPVYAAPAPLTPEELQAKRIIKLKEYRDELTENGGCLVQGKWFHTDVKSKQQQMALAMAGANLPAGLMWKTMDGSFIQMPPELAAEIFATQMTREATIFGICEAKQQDDTPINEGWPERYADTLIVEPVVE